MVALKCNTLKEIQKGTDYHRLTQFGSTRQACRPIVRTVNFVIAYEVC